jgi:nucleoside-diphosphate kinase
VQRTLAMIKPDAVRKQAIGPILAAINEAGLSIVACKMLRLTPAEAGGFYAVHQARPFYADLCAYMSSGKIVALVLEGEGAIDRWRKLMGPTDSRKAPPETIRGRFGTDIEQNAVHGSDADATAAFEIAFHFSGRELEALKA